MKRFTLTILALATPLAVRAATSDAPVVATPQTAPPVVAADAASKLSPPAHEVLKMAVAGVPDDVIKAYVESSGSTYNLTPDGIIQLQGAGVSSAVTSAMLTHDKAIIDRSSAYPPSMPPTAPAAEPAQQPLTYAAPEAQPSSVQVTTIPYDPSYYSGLSPYGTWYNDPSYGYYWQPYSWVDWSLYPWGFGVFGGGRWWHYPGRGWCWSPGVRFSAGVGFGGFRGGFGVGHSFGFHGSGGFSRGVSGFHSFGHSGGFSHSGGFGHSGSFGHSGGFGGHGGHR